MEELRCCEIATFAASKMFLMDSEISGPIPSPSIRVTVYLPYFKRSISIVMVIHLVMCSIYGRCGLRGWHRHRGEKRVRVGEKTYIRTLLTLELGNSLLCRAGVEADLFKRSKFSQLSIDSDLS